jgi:membrane-associated phospholipid phosphatase
MLSPPAAQVSAFCNVDENPVDFAHLVRMPAVNDGCYRGLHPLDRLSCCRHVLSGFQAWRERPQFI